MWVLRKSKIRLHAEDQNRRSQIFVSQMYSNSFTLRWNQALKHRHEIKEEDPSIEVYIYVRYAATLMVKRPGEKIFLSLSLSLSFSRSLFSLKTFSTAHRSVLSAIKIVSANSKEINLKWIRLHSTCLSGEGGHFISRSNYNREKDTDKTRDIKQNSIKNCVICCPLRKRNFKKLIYTKHKWTKNALFAVHIYVKLNITPREDSYIQFKCYFSLSNW